MRYGLDSFLPEGSFEHCGDHRIRLYGGGGGIVSGFTNAVSGAVSAVGKAVSDVGNTVATIGKQVGDVVVNDYKTVGGVVQSLSHGQIGEAINKAVGQGFNDISIMTGGHPNTNQTLGTPNASSGSQTIASGQSQQAPTSLNNQSVLGAPGVTGSLTTRTVSGPDNTYKIDKTTMLGL